MLLPPTMSAAGAVGSGGWGGGGLSWPPGGQASFPLDSGGLFSGKPDLPSTQNSRAGS